MYQKGLGGFFLCARQGQTVPYLSQKWFELVKYACVVAKEFGLEVWLYDEYPYPSGMAGGEVLKQHPEAQQMFLQHYRIDMEGGKEHQKQLGWENILFACAYRVREDGSRDLLNPLELKECIGSLQTTEVYQITGLTMYNNKRFFSYGPEKVLNVTLPEGRWSVEIYTEKPMEDFKFYGGFFDPCNSDAVRTFLDTTHKKYKTQMGANFHETVKGFFSDEVGLLSAIPWSSKVPSAFQKKKGYSILENLPALHDASWPDAYRIRYDLYDVVHQIFVDSYHRQVSEWCTENNIAYCTEVPSMRLSTQRYSDIPGGDTGHEKAGRSLEWIYDKYLPMPRYNSISVASLARQMGRERCLIESFHSVGWTMTLQDARWMIDRLCSNGINFFVFHAFYYSIDSLRKHDAPPSQFFQNPYWKHYKMLGDYVGRLCTFVSHTQDAGSIAILDPVPTLWALHGNPFQEFQYRGESEEEKKLCDRIRGDWVYIAKTILQHQLTYNHLDSEMLPNFKIEDGRLISGNAAYQLVIIPPSLFFEKHVIPILEEFVQQGGHLLLLGNLPCHSLDPTENDQTVIGRWKKLLADYPDRVTLIKTEGPLKAAGIEERMIARVEEFVREPVKVTLASEQERKSSIVSMRKDAQGRLYLSLINQGRSEMECTIWNRKTAAYRLMELSMEDGAQNQIGFLLDRFSIKIPPFASRYVCLEAVDAADAELKSEDKITEPLLLSTKQPFKISIEGGNVFRISAFEVSRDGIVWKECEPGTLVQQCSAESFLKADDFAFKSEFGTPKRISVAYPVELSYRNTVVVADYIPKLELLLDKNAVAGEFCIFINGHAVGKEQFYHRFINDPENLLADVTEYFKTGNNEIKVCGKATRDFDGLRDPLYLIGNFGVDADHKLITMPQEGHFDCNVIRGFPYYSGTMTFGGKISIHKNTLPENFALTFDFGNSCLDCLEVKLNGVSLGVRPFTPYQWKCRKEWVRDGENDLELIRTNTLASMLDGTYFDYEKHKLVSV